jgi:hypothetical protein
MAIIAMKRLKWEEPNGRQNGFSREKLADSWEIGFLEGDPRKGEN